MTGAVDYTREACERLAMITKSAAAHMIPASLVSDTITALRAALDTTEEKVMNAAEIAERDSRIFATGYARGVRDAAALARDGITYGLGECGNKIVVQGCPELARAILALLPATDATAAKPYMGQIMAECGCQREADCERAKRCLAEKEKTDAE
jgi:hypothetical protein